MYIGRVEYIKVEIHFTDKKFSTAVVASNVDKKDMTNVFARHTQSVKWKKENAARDTTIDLQILDLNGDNIADVSATKISGGVLNMRTETRLYLGRKGGGLSTTPNQVFTDEGFANLVRYEDVDLDGNLEMIHPYHNRAYSLCLECFWAQNSA